MNVKFYKHTCFSIENEKVIVLNDPYLKGTAFNDGWDLIKYVLEQNKEKNKNIIPKHKR